MGGNTPGPRLTRSQAGWGRGGDSPRGVVAAAAARQRPRQSAIGRGRVRRALRGKTSRRCPIPPPSRLRATDGAAGGMTGNSWARAAESKYEHSRQAREDGGARWPRTGPAARDAAAANSRLLRRRLHRPGPALRGQRFGAWAPGGSDPWQHPPPHPQISTAGSGRQCSDIQQKGSP